MSPNQICNHNNSLWANMIFPIKTSVIVCCSLSRQFQPSDIQVETLSKYKLYQSVTLQLILSYWGKQKSSNFEPIFNWSESESLLFLCQDLIVTWKSRKSFLKSHLLHQNYSQSTAIILFRSVCQFYGSSFEAALFFQQPLTSKTDACLSNEAVLEYENAIIDPTQIRVKSD